VTVVHGLGGVLHTTQQGGYYLGSTKYYSFDITSVSGNSNITSVSGNSTITLTYGPLFTGRKTATFNVANGLVSGTVDGRAIHPKITTEARGNLTFTDGEPMPDVSVSVDLTSSLAALHAQLNTAANTSCASPPPGLKPIAIDPLPFPTLVARGLDYNQDPGHWSNPSTDFDCFACLNWAANQLATEDAGCVAVCASLFLSFECGNCFSGAKGDFDDAVNGCWNGGACCPILCPTGGAFCCNNGEACLQNTGRCCSLPGQQPCGGDVCCNTADQTCMNGACCPIQQSSCGPQCCTGGTCLNGECCIGAVCGSACCGIAGTCVDASKSICCGQGQVLKDGICCGENQVVTDGVCCNVGETVCRGQCCPGTCTLKHGHAICTPTNSGCEASGGGPTCTGADTATCTPREGYSTACSNGCCIYEHNIP
jgi:hypothetical protein